LTDGAAGITSLLSNGGLAVVQDPHDALHSSMPEHALAAGPVQHVLPVSEIPAALNRLVSEPIWLEKDEVTALEDLAEDPPTRPLHHPQRSTHPRELEYRCPECHGPLHENEDDGRIRIACRIGHEWDLRDLASRHAIEMETALSAAANAWEQRSRFSRDLEKRAQARGHDHSASQFRRQAEQADEYAGWIHEMLTRVTGRNPAAR